jgi:hypothetical protein
MKLIRILKAVRIEFFVYIKSCQYIYIRCFILIKCSEQKARFKKYAIMSGKNITIFFTNIFFSIDTETFYTILVLIENAALIDR